MVDTPSSPPQEHGAEFQPRSNPPDITIPEHRTYLPEPRPTVVEPTSHIPESSAYAPASASSPQWQQLQSQSQPRPSDATTLDNNNNIIINHISPTASSSTWSPVSITASHPLAPVIRLSPQVEEDIKAAVLEAVLAQQRQQANSKNKRKNNTHASNSGGGGGRKRKKSVRRAPDGRRESPQTTRNWLIAKKVLRWVSLTICAMMVVGETVLAIFDGAYADTALGICLGFLLGIWDTVRLVRLRLKRDIEPVSVFHLLAEGTFTVAIIVAVACIVDQVRRFWAREFLIRGWVFSAGMLVVEGIHITLFARACVDKYLHRDAIDFRRYHGWELPWYEDPQPTEIVVKYVHVCPRCETEFSPGYRDDEEKVKETRSRKSEQQQEPQTVPTVVIT